MNLITKLSPLITNQIAAGEVIERPYSVLKECIENSLDAGASQVEVFVDGGGVQRIEIRDNGCGIAKEQLQLAVSRHATSKITTLEDIENIASLGFRGEALASIAAVARLSLTSCPRESDHGYCLSVDHDEELTTQLQPAAHPVGTTICVRDLFCNAPVRKKFLKTQRTEMLGMIQVFKAMALSHFDCGFRLNIEGQLKYQLPMANDDNKKLLRLQKCLGKTFSDQLVAVDKQNEGMRCHGWVSHQDSHCSDSQHVFCFVNGRWVRDPLLMRAVRQAYQQSIPPGRYPAVVLFISVPVNEVDVNVHPTKHELRFQKPRAVQDLMITSIYAALNTAAQPSVTATQCVSNTHNISNNPSRQHTIAHVNKTMSAPHLPRSSAIGQGQRRLQKQVDLYQKLYELPKPQATIMTATQPVFQSVIATIAKRYILTRVNGDVVVVDTRQAEQLILSHHWQAAIEGSQVAAKPLLADMAFEPNETIEQKLQHHTELLNTFGFDWRCHADRRYTLRSIPIFFETTQAFPAAWLSLLDIINDTSEADTLAKKWLKDCQGPLLWQNAERLLESLTRIMGDCKPWVVIDENNLAQLTKKSAVYESSS